MTVLNVEAGPGPAFWGFTSPLSAPCTDLSFWLQLKCNGQTPIGWAGGGDVGDTFVVLEYVDTVNPGDPWSLIPGNTNAFDAGTLEAPESGTCV